MGVNGVTGDYSRGAAGLHDPRRRARRAGGRDHHRRHTCSEMFAHLTPANDLRFRRGTDAPTIRVEGMTMAGA